MTDAWNRTGTRSCPACGSFNTRETTAGQTAMILGGLAGCAIVTARLTGRVSPLLASTLLAGGLIGTIWGASIGSMIGESLFCRGKCLACGEEF